MPECPHADFAFCPLYVAAHDCSGRLAGLTCIDGEIHWQTCAVDRGRRDYAETAALLRVRLAAVGSVTLCLMPQWRAA